MEIERIDYGDAIRQLAEQHSIPMDDFQSKRQSSPEYKSEKEKIKRMIKLAQEFFSDSLLKKSSPGGRRPEGSTLGVKGPETKEFHGLDASLLSAGHAYTYLTEQRGLSDTLITQLGLGYAPSQNMALFSYFGKHGFSEQDLVDAGLAKVREGSGEVYAFFRDRLTIPIRDQLGNVVAFGARALQKDQEPKYLNSSESIIYDKSGTLYGIDHLKSGVKEHKAAIIVEGYFDVIALQQGGYDIGVATCGTSLTAQHITTLKRYTDTIYFLFDNDNAGITATIRGLTIAYAQGMYPKIIKLLTPNSQLSTVKDIDDLVRNNPNAHTDIQMLIQSAQDGFEWALQHFAGKYDQLSPVEKERSMHNLFDIIQSVESINIQNHFLNNMDEHLLKRQGECEKSYKVYIAQKKKLGPKKNIQMGISDSQKKTTEERRLHRLRTLLENNFWEKLQIDADRIQTLQSFIDITKISKPDDILYDEIEMEREQELAVLTEGTNSTSLIKKILGPIIADIQKTAITQAAPDDKHKIVEIARKLR